MTHTMRRIICFLFFALFCCLPAFARARASGFCQLGNKTILVLGYRSSTSTPVQLSCPAATVTVYLTGTVTLATIYSNNSGTVLANPFTIGISPETSSIGYWFFYADNGNYDVQFSGTGVATPFKLTAVPVVDPGTTGGGSVLSVALALPSSIFTISGSPVTTSGTLTGTFASQSQNLFFASPNGSSGVPSMRAIVGVDLPNPGASSKGGIQSKDCSSGSQVVQKLNTDGTVTCVTPIGSVTSITATAPVVVTPSPIVSTGVASCPTCVTSAASLTSTAIMTGGGSQASQTPAATATMDASGNIATPGSVSTNVGSTTAGAVALPQGSATAASPVNSVGFQAPTSVPTAFRITLWGSPAAGLIRTTSATPSVASVSELSGDCVTSGSNATVCNPASSVSAASAAGAAKMTCVSSGATKTCTYIDFPDVQSYPAAYCDDAVPYALWSIGSSGVVTCRAGTNNVGAFIAITDTANTFAQFVAAIPSDWDSSTNPYIRVKFASADTTVGHTVIPAIRVSCSKGDGTTTDDVTFNASHSLSTVTLNATANQFWTSSAQMNGTDTTGCVAGGMMLVQVGRATDTGTSAYFYAATITFPRLLTVQAN